MRAPAPGSPLDPVAGHIPGALNRPFADNIGPDGHFKPARQLRTEFEVLLAGRDPRSVVHHHRHGRGPNPDLAGVNFLTAQRSRDPEIRRSV
jgi:3-mercaptopyruvate sulfurtransferase SseA